MFVDALFGREAVFPREFVNGFTACDLVAKPFDDFGRPVKGRHVFPRDNSKFISMRIARFEGKSNGDSRAM